MKCVDLDLALSEGAGPASLPVQLQEHVDGCMRCRQLLSAIDSAAVSDAPSEDQLQRIETRLVSDLKRVRPLPARRYIVLALLGISGAILAILFGFFELGAYGIDAMNRLQAALVLITLALGITLLADSLTRQMAPGSRHWSYAGILPFGVAAAVGAVVRFAFPFEPDEDFWANSWVCIKIGTAVGIGAAISMWAVLRRGAFLSPVISGTAVGAIAGLVGTSVLQVHCPNLDVWHVVVSHVGVTILCSLIGLMTGFGVHLMRQKETY